MTDGTLLNNPKDPLGDIGFASRELFTRLGRGCNGFPQEAVMNASANLLINALRQQNKTRASAEVAFNELFGHLKAVLLNHYDSVTHNRRNIYPFDQHIVMPHTNFRSKFPQ